MTAHLPFVALPETDAAWLTFVSSRMDGLIARAEQARAQLKDGSVREASAALDLWNELQEAALTVAEQAGLFTECHPAVAVREAAEASALAVGKLFTQLSLDRELWQVFDGLDATGLDEVQARELDHLLRDFRLAGVHLDDVTRERLTSLADRATELAQQFDRNIRDGRRELRLTPAQLAGLPQDFLDAHRVDDEGLVTVTTDYPDLMPIREYATERSTRWAMTDLQNGLAWEANEPVLAELLRNRQERAELLGFRDWADVETATRMAGSSARVHEFLAEVDAASAGGVDAEYELLLARLRQDVPEADAVTTADFAYLVSAVKREQFDVDAQQVRSYFAFDRVLPGVLDLTADLLGLAYRQVDVPRWHDDVLAYEVTREGAVIGRFFLDLHPRDGKYNHAACFTLTTGVAETELPEGVLLCNFTRGLMEHDEVVTFLHEFGHLVHAIVAGHQRFVRQSGIATEWDFVEAPSQMLEEWAWDADVLARFAQNDAGEVIPASLVQRMRTADAFGRVLSVRRQLGLAQVSYRLHADVPADIQAATQALLEASTPVRSLPGGGRFAGGFGHLTGYGACYYTYQWSLVISRDLLTAFAGDLMDHAVADRYRDQVLAPGGTKDADDLISAFLGRRYTVDAYREWLAGE